MVTEVDHNHSCIFLNEVLENDNRYLAHALMVECEMSCEWFLRNKLGMEIVAGADALDELREQFQGHMSLLDVQGTGVSSANDVFRDKYGLLTLFRQMVVHRFAQNLRTDLMNAARWLPHMLRDQERKRRFDKVFADIEAKVNGSQPTGEATNEAEGVSILDIPSVADFVAPPDPIPHDLSLLRELSRLLEASCYRFSLRAEGEESLSDADAPFPPMTSALRFWIKIWGYENEDQSRPISSVFKRDLDRTGAIDRYGHNGGSQG